MSASPGAPGAHPPNVHLFRVRAHQTDLNAAMYHGAYLDIFDDARIETFRALGYDYRHLLQDGLVAVIRQIECRFTAPARMDDLLTVTVTVPRMGAASMTIRYSCCKEDGVSIAEATAVFAFVNAEGKPQRVLPSLRQVVESHADIFQYATRH